MENNREGMGKGTGCNSEQPDRCGYPYIVVQEDYNKGVAVFET